MVVVQVEIYMQLFYSSEDQLYRSAPWSIRKRILGDEGHGRD